jgi:reductive dehalogenase
MVYLITILILLFLLFFLPIKGGLREMREVPQIRHDERHTMFSRNENKNDPGRQEHYYNEYPENLEKDKVWIDKPGLLSEQSNFYHPFSFAAADASFEIIGHLRPYVDGNVNADRKVVDAEKLSKFIRKWGLKLGAVSVGFCEMKDYHFYSKRGRGDQYGKEVLINHKFGIALTVEMNEEFLATGPAGPTLMESAQQYLNSGVIALQIAEFLRKLGYEARAHIDGNYEVIAPLVARDAGLGEIGRMGLLMVPKLGPRVRIAVITTNAPIQPDLRKPDYTVHDFCNICKKCAFVCPSQALSKGNMEMINGVGKWQVNHEKCFSFWCTSGTDCGRCMSVCPYAHKNNWLHNFVRWGIRNNFFFRRAAVYLDDIFYGKKPKPKDVPDWMQ